MFCQRCGCPCEESAIHCPGCGNPLSHSPVVFTPPKKGSHLPPVIIMAVMLCLGVICFFLFPKNRNDNLPDPTPQRSHFEFSNGTIQFWEDNYTGGSSLTVPETIDNMPVLRIGECCFLDCDTLEEVILPAGIIEIDDSAFSDCDALRGIYIPGNVFRIGERAFADCEKLEAIYIHDSIQTIEMTAFDGCRNLRHVFFSGSVDQWTLLFQGELPDSVTLYCDDGVFQQFPSRP